ncbi:hypothetical protein ACFYRW_22300 [Rhodococcus pyridinivorans]
MVWEYFGGCPPAGIDGKYTRGDGEYVDDYDDGIARTQQYRPS